MRAGVPSIGRASTEGTPARSVPWGGQRREAPHRLADRHARLGRGAGAVHRRSVRAGAALEDPLLGAV